MNKSMIKLLKNKIKSFIVFILENLNIIFDIVFIITLFVFNEMLNAIILSLVFILSQFIKLLKEVNESEMNKFPKCKTRFTNKKENGDIYIHNYDLQKAIIQLSRFEDYAESKGYIINEK